MIDTEFEANAMFAGAFSKPIACLYPMPHLTSNSQVRSLVSIGVSVTASIVAVGVEIPREMRCQAMYSAKAVADAGG